MTELTNHREACSIRAGLAVIGQKIQWVDQLNRAILQVAWGKERVLTKRLEIERTVHARVMNSWVKSQNGCLRLSLSATFRFPTVSLNFAFSSFTTRRNLDGYFCKRKWKWSPYKFASRFHGSVIFVVWGVSSHLPLPSLPFPRPLMSLLRLCMEA